MASEEKGNLFTTTSLPEEEPEEGEIQDDSLEDVSSEDDNDSCVKNVRQNSVWYSTKEPSKGHHHLQSQGRTNLNFTRNKPKHFPSRGIQENKDTTHEKENRHLGRNDHKIKKHNYKKCKPHYQPHGIKKTIYQTSEVNIVPAYQSLEVKHAGPSESSNKKRNREVQKVNDKVVDHRKQKKPHIKKKKSQAISERKKLMAEKLKLMHSNCVVSSYPSRSPCHSEEGAVENSLKKRLLNMMTLNHDIGLNAGGKSPEIQPLNDYNKQEKHSVNNVEHKTPSFPEQNVNNTGSISKSEKEDLPEIEIIEVEKVEPEIITLDDSDCDDSAINMETDQSFSFSIVENTSVNDEINCYHVGMPNETVEETQTNEERTKIPQNSSVVELSSDVLENSDDFPVDSLQNNVHSENTLQKKSQTNEPVEDDDLSFLRLQALLSNKAREPKKVVEKGIAEDDELELRLAALRSAYLKKHMNRKQRGILSNVCKESSQDRPSEQGLFNSSEVERNKSNSTTFVDSKCASSVKLSSEPDEITAIVDMDLSNTDDEKESESNITSSEKQLPNIFTGQTNGPEVNNVQEFINSFTPNSDASGIKNAMNVQILESIPVPTNNMWTPLNMYSDTYLNNSTLYPQNYKGGLITFPPPPPPPPLPPPQSPPPPPPLPSLVSPNLTPPPPGTETYPEEMVSKTFGFVDNNIDNAISIQASVSEVKNHKPNECNNPVMISQICYSSESVKQVSIHEDNETRQNFQLTDANGVTKSLDSEAELFTNNFMGQANSNESFRSDIEFPHCASNLPVSDSFSNPTHEMAENIAEVMDISSMIVLDEIGHTSSPESHPHDLDAESLQAVDQDCEIDNVDEDDEILRARLLESLQESKKRIPSSKSVRSEDPVLLSRQIDAISVRTVKFNAGKPITRTLHPTIRNRALTKQYTKQKASAFSNVLKGKFNGLALNKYKKTLVNKVGFKQKTADFPSNATFANRNVTNSGLLQVTVPTNEFDLKGYKRKVAPQSENQKRFVISLGEDSDSCEEDTVHCSLRTSPKRRCVAVNTVLSADDNQLMVEKLRVEVPSNSKADLEMNKNSSLQVVKPNILDSPAQVSATSSDFMKSLDKLLKQARSETEISSSKPSLTDTTKLKLIQQSVHKELFNKTPREVKIQNASSIVSTPLAVRYLPSSQQEEYRRLKLQLALKQKQFAINAPSNTKASDGAKVLLTLKKSPHKIIRKNVTVTQKPFSAASNTVINNEKTEVLKKTEITDCGSIKGNEIREKSNTGNKSSSIGKKVSPVSPMKPNKTVICENNSMESAQHSKNVKSCGSTGQIHDIVTELVSSTVNLSSLPIEIMTKETESKSDVLSDLLEVKIPNSNDTNLEKVTGHNDFVNCENGRNSATQNTINENGKLSNITRETLLQDEDSVLINSPNIENDMLGLVDDKSELDNSCQSFQQKDSTTLPFTGSIDKEIEESKNIDENIGNLKHKLVNSEQDLLSKRYAVLDDLTEISQLLRQIELEQVIKVECEEEVDRLSLELQRAQLKLKNQRLLVNEMRTRCAEARKRVKTGRRDCAILSQACQCLGQQIVGRAYRVPSGGADLMKQKLQHMAVQAKRLSRKCDEVPAINSNNESVTLDSELLFDLNLDTKFASEFGSDSSVIQNVQESSHEIVAAAEHRLVLNPCDGFSSNCDRNCSPEPFQARQGEIDQIWLQRQYHLPKYNSPLEHINFNSDQPVDPNAILCPYQLRGTCHDEECLFQHHNASHSLNT